MAPEFPQRIAVIGAGIAGASVAYAASRRGVRATVYDPNPEEGASRVPRAMVHPFAGQRAAASMRRVAAFWEVRGWCDEFQPNARSGVLRLGADARKAEVWEKAARKWHLVGDWIPPESLADAEPGLSSEFIGGIDVPDGLCIDGKSLVEALLDASDCDFVPKAVSAVGSEENLAWLSVDGERRHYDAIVIAAGVGAAAFGFDGVIQPMAGATVVLDGPGPTRPLAALGQLIPVKSGTMVAGTHRPNGLRVVCDDDRERLLEKARRTLPRMERARVIDEWAGVRAASRDRRPIVGQVGPGVFVLGGLGSKGFLLAPRAATLLVASWFGASELPEDWAPQRFEQT